MTSFNTKEIQKAYGTGLAHVLHEHGLTHKNLADATGISLGTVNHYVQGIQMPSAYRAYQIAIATGVLVSDVLDGEFNYSIGLASKTPHTKEEFIAGVSKIIAKMAKIKGLAQNELAEKAGVNVGTLANVMLCKRAPGLALLEHVSNALGVKVDDLLPY